MEGRLIIDGRDMGAHYGAYVTDQGLNALLSWPATKEIDIDSWAESGYCQADLSDLRLAAKEMSVDFALRSHPSDIVPMCSWLAGSANRTWAIASIGRSYRLRYVGADALTAWPTIQTFGVNVALDSPLDGYEYLAPVSHISAVDEYDLDGTPLSDYGVRVLYGTLNSTAAPGSVKERLKRNVSVVDGIIYDTGVENVPNPREIVLRCALIDPTMSGLWRNYDALLYDLIKKNISAVYDTDRCKRTLYSYNLDRHFDCYYKSQTVTGFYPEGDMAWILFDITFGIVGQN